MKNNQFQSSIYTCFYLNSVFFDIWLNLSEYFHFHSLQIICHERGRMRMKVFQVVLMISTSLIHINRLLSNHKILNFWLKTRRQKILNEFRWLWENFGNFEVEVTERCHQLHPLEWLFTTCRHFLSVYFDLFELKTRKFSNL